MFLIFTNKHLSSKCCNNFILKMYTEINYLIYVYILHITINTLNPLQTNCACAMRLHKADLFANN